jgi:hypothetical protein
MHTKPREFNREAPSWPKDPRVVKLVEREIEFGHLGELPGLALPNVPRYLVTYMNSQTGGRIRSATVVSVTNQSSVINRVWVSYFKGFSDNTSPVCVCAFAIPPDFTVDFSSRDLPTQITTCNCVCNPELTFDEGRAIVSSMYPEIGVSSRVYYTSGDDDSQLLSITDSKVVVFGKGNLGD